MGLSRSTVEPILEDNLMNENVESLLSEAHSLTRIALSKAVSLPKLGVSANNKQLLDRTDNALLLLRRDPEMDQTGMRGERPECYPHLDACSDGVFSPKP